MAVTLNDAAYRHARRLIEAGRSVLDDRNASERMAAPIRPSI